MNRRNRIIFLIFWIVFIFLLTGYPSVPLPPINQFPVDKVAHALIFLIMGLIQRRLFKVRLYCLLGAAVVLVAEFQQLIIPGRTFEIGDILAGLFGIAIPLILVRGKIEPGPTEENVNMGRTQNGLSKT